jgi:hypothetical protein
VDELLQWLCESRRWVGLRGCGRNRECLREGLFGDTFGPRHQVRRAGFCDFPDEGDDGLFGFTIIPGRKRVLRIRRACGRQGGAGNDRGERHGADQRRGMEVLLQ